MIGKETAPFEKQFDTKTSSGQGFTTSRRVDDMFDCEEGASESHIPMPGLLRTGAARGQDAPAAGYTNDSAPLRSASPGSEITALGWAEDDGPEFQMPGLIVSMPVEEQPATAIKRPTKGLCGTCVLFETCTYAKPESGVWRCEEYR